MECISMEESQYWVDLDMISRKRYRQLITKYVGCDPYPMKISEFSSDIKDLSNIEALDITNYLVLQTSYYTKQQMKAYKCLEA